MSFDNLQKSAEYLGQEWIRGYMMWAAGHYQSNGFCATGSQGLSGCIGNITKFFSRMANSLAGLLGDFEPFHIVQYERDRSPRDACQIRYILAGYPFFRHVQASIHFLIY